MIKLSELRPLQLKLIGEFLNFVANFLKFVKVFEILLLPQILVFEIL